jgi:steroid delta-isomerase-like uncharacterized protein
VIALSATETSSLIGRYYDAFNKGDINGMLACVADDVVHDVNQGERRIGKSRFHAFCARMSHHYIEELCDIVVMTSPDGSRAAAEFNVHGTYLVAEDGLPPASGQKYVLPAGAFFAVRNDLIARVTTYYNLTDWIVQVSAPATVDAGKPGGGPS